jgi:hypothetical protein
MRCPRCSYDSPGDARTCERCGMALPSRGDAAKATQTGLSQTAATNPGGTPQLGAAGRRGDAGLRGDGGGQRAEAGQPSAAGQRGEAGQSSAPGQPGEPAQVGDPAKKVGPAWSRPSQAAESPPWSGSHDAAPWQTPPQHSPAGKWTSKAPEPSVGDLPSEPTRPAAATYPWALWRILVVVLAVSGVCVGLYGLFALFPRRGIFAELANDPTQVSHNSAAASDVINIVLFVAAGVTVVAAVVLMALWALRVRRIARRGSAGLNLVWRLVTGVGFALVLVALILHMSTSPGRIALGYLLLGLGALLLSIAALWAVSGVRRAGREAALTLSAPPVQTASP